MFGLWAFSILNAVKTGVFDYFCELLPEENRMLRIFLIAFYLTSLSTISVAQINSVQDGDWDDPDTWDCTCVPDVNSFDFILVNHDVTITNDINLNLVTITSGSSVTINTGVTVTIEEDFANTPLIVDAGGLLVNNGTLDLASLLFFIPCEIYGTIQSSSDIIIGDPSILLFQSGSTYRHSFATGGDIPSAIWDPSSTVEISGLTDASPAAPNNLNQTFGNFVWNTPGMGTTTTFSLGGQLQNILGNLRFVSTGSPSPRVVRLASSTSGYTLTVGGDFIVEGGTYFLSNSLSSASLISVAGNFSMSAGNLGLTQTNASDITLSINGNFEKTGGTLNSGAGVGAKNILFSGNGSDQNYSVNTLTAAFNFIVQSGSVLNLGTNPLITSGTNGTFTLNGTVRVGSLNSSGAIQGNIPMPTRLFNSGSRIIYNGSAPQFMGSAHPNNVAGVTTEIDNASGVTLAADVTLGGNLILTSGNLSISNRTLTLNGGFTPNSNFLNVLSTSSISIGGTGAFGTLQTTGSTTINNFTLNRPASGSVTLGTDLTIAGTLTQTVGDIILNGRTLTISGPYSRTEGSFAIDASSNFIVNGSGSLPSGIQFITPQALNSLTLDRASATLATSSSFTVTNLNLRSGTFNNTGTITIATGGVITRTEGSLISNTPTAQTSYDLVYDISTNISSGAEVPNLTTELRHVTKLGGATLTLTEPFTINGDLTLSNGIFDAGSNAIDLKGNLVANSTSLLTGSPFTFSGTTSISGGALIQFGEVTITGTVTPTVNIRIDGDLVNDGTLNAGTGSQTVTFGGNTTISGASAHNFNNVTITGTLVAPSVMSVAGNFALSGGTFTNSTGTVVFNGTSSITGSPQFNNITVNTGATLNGPSNLTMAGNFIVNGTFNSGTGRVTFNGTSNQDVNRTAGTAGTVNLFNVTVNKSSGTLNFRSTIANTIFRIQNEFTLAQAGTSSPDVDFDGPGGTGNVVLASTATRTAKVTSVPAGAQIVGNLTAERFVQNDDGLRAWRYLASPLEGATVADWQGEIQITGQFSNPSTGGSITNPNAPSMYRWTETNGGDANNRYEVWPNNISLPASSFALTNGRGYATYIRNVGNPVLTTRGTLRFGDVGIGLTITGSEPDAAGFNLVGNPYPAPVDWDLVSLPGGVSTIISMLDNVGNGGLGNGQYVYYTQGGPQVGTFNGIIGSGQAFWVETSTSTTLTFSESHKASDINPVVIRERQLANILRIGVEGNGWKDETVVYFRDEASDEYDMSFDARKRENEYINLFTYQQREAGMEKFAINALKDINCSREISLGMEKFSQGTYSFYFTELESFDKTYIFTLIDNFTGISTSLEEGAYTFQVTENPLSNGNERFKIMISEVGINAALSVQGDEECDVVSASINIEQTEPEVFYQAYFDGVALGEAVSGNGSSISLSLTGGTFEPGVYEIPVKAFNSCSELFLDQKASLVIIDVLEAEITSEGNTLYSNYTSGNQWYLDGTPIEGATGQAYEASASGLYKLVVTTTEGCTTEADRQFVITSNETGIDQEIRVYPNPVQSIVKVEVRSAGPVEVKLMTTLGVELTSKALTGSGFEKYAEFDLSNQSNGMYILHVQKGGRVHQVKIIKTNE